MQRVAVIGCGAVGGYYGGLLQRAGAAVSFVVPRDEERLRAHGLRVESPRGNFHLPDVAAFRDPREVPPVDVVIVALKTLQNPQLASLLPPLMEGGGTVLMLQNGLGEEAHVAALPGVRRVMAGLCFLCASKLAPGHIRHQDYGHISLGEWSPGDAATGITDAMRVVAADFASAGVRVELEPDLLAARWKKLVWNIPFNGLTVALAADTSQLLARPAVRRRVRALMEEVVAVARADGHPVPDGVVDQMIAHTEVMRPYHTSMKLDFDAGRPMELESMFAAPLARAAAHGVPMPLTTALLQELRALERAAGRAPAAPHP